MAKSQIAKRVYVDSKGEEFRSPVEDTQRLEFRFTNGSLITVTGETFPANIVTIMAWHGASQKVGDAFSDAKGDVDVAYTDAMAMVEQLGTGTWTERAKAGPRITLLLEAIVRALTKQGETVDAERSARIAKSLEDEATRVGAHKDPPIKAEYKAIEAERAAERAAKALEAAGESKVAGAF